MTSIDTAADEGRAPEVALRQIFLIAGVGESDRVTIAKNGFTTVDLIANLADDLPAFHSAITTLFGDDMGAGAAKLIKLATLATMWRQCKALVSMKVDQASKLHEDPNRIPEIQQLCAEGVVRVRARPAELNEADLGTKMVDVRRMTSLLKGTPLRPPMGWSSWMRRSARLQRQQKIAVY